MTLFDYSPATFHAQYDPGKKKFFSLFTLVSCCLGRSCQTFIISIIISSDLLRDSIQPLPLFQQPLAHSSSSKTEIPPLDQYIMLILAKIQYCQKI